MRLDLERIALEYVVPCLHDIGFCYLDNFLGEVVGDCVLERVKRMHRDGELADGQLAGPSRGVAKRHLRGDQIKWIGGTEEGCEAINFLLTLIDRLVMYCGSRLGKYYVKERSKVRVCGSPDLLSARWKRLPAGPTRLAAAGGTCRKLSTGTRPWRVRAVGGCLWLGQPHGAVPQHRPGWRRRRALPERFPRRQPLSSPCRPRPGAEVPLEAGPPAASASPRRCQQLSGCASSSSRLPLLGFLWALRLSGPASPMPFSLCNSVPHFAAVPGAAGGSALLAVGLEPAAPRFCLCSPQVRTGRTSAGRTPPKTSRLDYISGAASSPPPPCQRTRL